MGREYFNLASVGDQKPCLRSLGQPSSHCGALTKCAVLAAGLKDGFIFQDLEPGSICTSPKDSERMRGGVMLVVVEFIWQVITLNTV